MKFYKNKKVLLSLFGLLFLFGTTGYTYSDRFFEVAKAIDLFTKVYKELAFSYVDEINPEEMMRAGIRGMLASIDPYTVFMDEKKQDDIDLLTNGKYGGIGVSIGMRDGKAVLLEIMDGYSAQKQGLIAGDIINKVDGTPVTEKNFDNISAMVKGDPGSFVKLEILRAGTKDTLNFELLREEIKVKSITYAGFYPENSDIAYIKLTQFSRPAGEEVKNALLELKKQRPVAGVIFDLRNNPGGLLDIAVDISNRFLNKGQLIVTTKGRSQETARKYFATQEPMLKDVPLILLVNEGSASASEIFAGAIQDHDRGLILGEKSFGKGLVQTIAPLSYNTSLKITTSKYFTPSGRCIQKIDYFKDNKVLANTDSLTKNSFNTDGQRTVFSSGGITPDTVVVEQEYPGVIRDMLAKGIFFKFVTDLIAENGKEKSLLLADNELINLLKSYISKQNFTYKTEVEKKFDELVDLSKKQKQYSQLTQKFLDLQSSIKKTSAFEYTDFTKEMLEEIRIELAGRSHGIEGRVKESLKYDGQFQSAVTLIKNQSTYKFLLSGKH